MPNYQPLIDPNDPLAAPFVSRNPFGILSLAMRARQQIVNGAPQGDPNVAGSNNAGGLASPATPMENTNSFNGPVSGMGFGRLSSGNGIYRSSNRDNSMSSMPQFNDPTSGANNGGSMFGGSPVSFAAGGMITSGGGAIRPGAGMMPENPQLGATGPAPVENSQIDQEAQKFITAHPEEVQKIQQVIAYAMQTGELTVEELNTAVQLARTALASPGSYPQIRQFAIKNGLGTEQDIPQQMDQGLLYVLLVAGKSLQASPQGAPQGDAMTGQPPAPTSNGIMPSYKEGGMTGDKAHIAKLHAREYVIPEDALIYHGKKHFDKLVEQARTPPSDGTN